MAGKPAGVYLGELQEVVVLSAGVQFRTGALARIDRDKVASKAKLEGLDAQARFEYSEALLQLRTR